MNDFGDDLWKCHFCQRSFTDVEWATFVPKWAQEAPGIQLLMHEAYVQPYRVRKRLLK